MEWKQHLTMQNLVIVAAIIGALYVGRHQLDENTRDVLKLEQNQIVLTERVIRNEMALGALKSEQSKFDNTLNAVNKTLGEVNVTLAALQVTIDLLQKQGG
ncbi:hypothetical protein ACHELR_000318 [Vibrio fluvialis]